jgi:hypothetical protein
MLEAGKYYINRSGEKVGPISGESLFGLERDPCRWYSHGNCFSVEECKDDLISPYYEWRYCIPDKVGLWAIGSEYNGEFYHSDSFLVSQVDLDGMGSPHPRWMCWLGDFKINKPELVWPDCHNKPCIAKIGQSWMDVRLVGKDGEDYLVTEASYIHRVKRENIRCV